MTPIDGQHLDIRDIIDEVMDNFEFNKVKAMMKAVDWTYYGEDKAPTVDVLRAVARSIIEGAHNDCLVRCCRGYSSGSGFSAECWYDDNIDNFCVNLHWGIDNSNVY